MLAHARAVSVARRWHMLTHVLSAYENTIRARNACGRFRIDLAARAVAILASPLRHSFCELLSARGRAAHQLFLPIQNDCDGLACFIVRRHGDEKSLAIGSWNKDVSQVAARYLEMK